MRQAQQFRNDLVLKNLSLNCPGARPAAIKIHLCSQCTRNYAWISAAAPTVHAQSETASWASSWVLYTYTTKSSDGNRSSSPWCKMATMASSRSNGVTSSLLDWWQRAHPSAVPTPPTVGSFPGEQIHCLDSQLQGLSHSSYDLFDIVWS